MIRERPFGCSHNLLIKAMYVTSAHITTVKEMIETGVIILMYPHGNNECYNQ